MKKKLYLHIGTGKTGTTSIQKTFEQRENNFKFFYDMDGPKHFVDVNEFIRRINDCPVGVDKVVYSNEWSFRASDKVISNLSKALLDSFDVTVLIYFRRQDEFDVSRNQQIGKSGNGTTKSHFALSGNEDDLDYLQIADKWARYFPVTVRVFDRSKLLNGDVVIDFSHLIGEKIDKTDVIFINESAGKVKVRLGHAINDLGLNHLRGKLLPNIPDDEKMLPSREAAFELYSKYMESNKLLFAKYTNDRLSFSDDFSKYPLSSNESWDEQSATKAINSLLLKCDLNSQMLERKQYKVNKIRDAALKLSRIDLSLARDLMQIAHELRPNGSFIKEKLVEYEKALNKKG